MPHPISTQWLAVGGPDGSFDAYLALPPGGSGPGLLLLQEIFGVNPHIRSVAEQYAQDGFVVLAPDLFWRHAPRVELGYDGEDAKRAYELMGTVKSDQVLGDMKATLDVLKGRAECSGKVGAIGYCMGGRLAFSAAAMMPVDAAVAYYGGGIQNQLALAPQVRCPVQFHYGEQDDHIPLSAVEQVRGAMADHKGTEFHVYPGAGHGFNCWARGSYHPRSATLAHGRSLAFLAQQLY
ncbi:MAG TPA: dienelactone hydrolase family protein [Ideonella sp.]|uniref:dienelactone hydrolase family protein n=1 Tax=Ideonella sp. TaxID=1929293 RepID=UPI002BF968AF|nr:dienelactone hydrolase family protein [Ideonella sp.]HSI51105.1 dienelactone hydrolase family protein [Ideonella sp.]